MAKTAPVRALSQRNGVGSVVDERRRMVHRATVAVLVWLVLVAVDALVWQWVTGPCSST